MSAFADQKRRLRARSEHVLRIAAMEDVARRYPSRTVKSALAAHGITTSGRSGFTCWVPVADEDGVVPRETQATLEHTDCCRG